MRLLPFRYFITKRYLFHFTLKSLVVTILTRPYFFLNPPPFLFSEIFGNITEDLTTVLSQGNSWFISVPLPLSILCSVERAQFRAGNFTRIFSSLVCFATAISGPLLFFFFFYHECTFADRCLCTTFTQCSGESEGAAKLVGDVIKIVQSQDDQRESLSRERESTREGEACLW